MCGRCLAAPPACQPAAVMAQQFVCPGNRKVKELEWVHCALCDTPLIYSELRPVTDSLSINRSVLAVVMIWACAVERCEYPGRRCRVCARRWRVTLSRHGPGVLPHSKQVVHWNDACVDVVVVVAGRLLQAAQEVLQQGCRRRRRRRWPGVPACSSMPCRQRRRWRWRRILCAAGTAGPLRLGQGGAAAGSVQWLRAAVASSVPWLSAAGAGVALGAGIVIEVTQPISPFWHPPQVLVGLQVLRRGKLAAKLAAPITIDSVPRPYGSRYPCWQGRMSVQWVRKVHGHGQYGGKASTAGHGWCAGRGRRAGGGGGAVEVAHSSNCKMQLWIAKLTKLHQAAGPQLTSTCNAAMSRLGVTIG